MQHRRQMSLYQSEAILGLLSSFFEALLGLPNRPIVCHSFPFLLLFLKLCLEVLGSYSFCIFSFLLHGYVLFGLFLHGFHVLLLVQIQFVNQFLFFGSIMELFCVLLWSTRGHDLCLAFDFLSLSFNLPFLHLKSELVVDLSLHE